MSRGLGDFGYKDKENFTPQEQKVSPEPDVKIHKIDSTEEFLVLACDGVWDVITNDELCAYVRKLMRNGEKNVKNIAVELLDFSFDAGRYEIRAVCKPLDHGKTHLCHALGSRDNMSVVLVKFPMAPTGEGPGVQPIRDERKKREEAEKAST